MTKRTRHPDQVYFMQRADGTGPIKIGTSCMVATRLKQIGYDLRAKMSVLAVAPGSYTEEARLHRQFESDRQTGEWFTPSADLLDIIAHVVAHGELPEASGEDMVSAMSCRYLGGETLEGIAHDYGITRERVRQILRKYGVPSLGLRVEHRRKPSPVSADEIEMARLYAEGVRPCELAERFPHLGLSFVLRRTGTESRCRGDWNRRADNERILETIKAMYPTGATSREIAEACNLPHQTAVYRYLRILGIKASRRNKATNLSASEIITAYRSGDTASIIAQRFNAPQHAIVNLLHKHGVYRTRAENEAVRIAAVRRANALRKGTSRPTTKSEPEPKQVAA